MVAPISVTSPSSTAGSSASCCALLKRWISSRKKIVGWPVARRRSVGALDHRPHLGAAGVDRRLLLERPARGGGDDPRQRRLARSRAARRGPSSAARRSRSPSAGSSPRPSRCSWPTSSSSVRGRIRTASGASAAGTGVRRSPAPVASGVEQPLPLIGAQYGRRTTGNLSAMGEETRGRRRAGSGAEAVELLSELIRLDTVNPPGNERPAQELLAARLGDAGFECSCSPPSPGARTWSPGWPGEAPGPDALPARPRRHGPGRRLGVELRPLVRARSSTAMVRGRGAQDMKGQVAAEVAAVDRARRRRLAPGARRAEAGDHRRRGEGRRRSAPPGSATSTRTRSAPTWSSTRAAATRSSSAAGASTPLCVGEKGINRFVLRARGVAGHGSIPALGDNALLKLAPALSGCAASRRSSRHPRASRSSTALLGEELDRRRRQRARGRGRAPARPFAAGHRAARRADAAGDAGADPDPRLGEVERDPVASRGAGRLPGAPRAADRPRSRERLEAVLGPLADGLEVEFSDRSRWSATARPPDSPLADAIGAWLAEADPGATLVPIVMPGFSDSHWFRKAFDSATVYGFCPQRELRAARGAAARPRGRRARRGRRRRAGGRASTPTSAGGCSDERRDARAPTAPAPTARARLAPMRLGGMALRNGLLIHGPTSWAIAARAADGTIEVASGAEAEPRPRPARRSAAAARAAAARRGARGGAARPAAARSARLPFEDRAVLASMVAERRASGALRRLAHADGRARGGDRGARSAAGADRAAQSRPRRLPRGRAQGDRRLRAGAPTRPRSRRSTSAAART